MHEPHSVGTPCPTCGEGTIQIKKIKNYKAKIRGYPFVVPEATMGMCDNPACDERPVSARERRRWEELFEQALEARYATLTPAEITRLRERLNLSKKDFAHLLGVSVRSIHLWEKTDRQVPPSRVSDLMMKLVQRSLTGEPVEVIDLLLEEAQKWGLTIQVQREVAA